MKAYRFNAVYNDILLCEFLISDTSDFNFLAQNLCNSMKATYKKGCVYVYTKKKRHLWDRETRLFSKGLSKPLNELSLRSGKKILVAFDEKDSEGIEIQYMLKSQIDKPASSKKARTSKKQFEIISLNELLSAEQLSKMGLQPVDAKTRKTATSKDQPELNTNRKKPKNVKKDKTTKKASEVADENANEQSKVVTAERKISVNSSFDEDFVDNTQDQEAQFDFDEETMKDFETNDYIDEEDDEEAPDEFSSDGTEDEEENLDETLEDIEDDEFSYDDNSYDDDLYPDDDEDFMEKYDKIDDEEDFFQRDDYEYYYEDEQDDDDYDKY